jgi:hypothetical protein
MYVVVELAVKPDLYLRFGMKPGQYRTIIQLMTGSKKTSRPEHSSTRQ